MANGFEYLQLYRDIHQYDELGIEVPIPSDIKGINLIMALCKIPIRELFLKKTSFDAKFLDNFLNLYSENIHLTSLYIAGLHPYSEFSQTTEGAIDLFFGKNETLANIYMYHCYDHLKPIIDNINKCCAINAGYHNDKRFKNIKPILLK